MATAQSLSLASLDAVSQQQQAHAVQVAHLGAACRQILDGASTPVAVASSDVPHAYLATVTDLLAAARERHRTLLGTVDSRE